MLQYNLHDSLIESVRYFADRRRVEIGIDLCNWMQPGYTDPEPENVRVTMVFEGVGRFEMSDAGYLFDGDEILVADEIDERTVKIVYRTAKDVGIILVTADRIVFSAVDPQPGPGGTGE